MSLDLIIEGRALIDGELRETCVGIADGKIVSVGQISEPGTKRRILRSDEFLMPGFIDPHVHLRDPGATHKEDFLTGTTAAVHAGVTCIFDMPNTMPPVVDIDTLNEKKRAVSGRSVVDYGLFAAVTEGLDAKILAPHVVGFKLFMGSTTGNILLNGDGMVPAVRDALDTGKRLSVHAEDDSLILKDEEKDCDDHLRNRPSEAEWNAIRRLADDFRGEKVNICHITTPQGLDMAKEAGFSTEVTLHHILFDTESHKDSFHKVNPPVRDRTTREQMYQRFRNGEFDMIGTDHAPHTLEEKNKAFNQAPSGIPGVETTMPILLDMVRTGSIDLGMVSTMASVNPGRLFDIPKGRIAPGYDADLVTFSLGNVKNIESGKLHSKCGHSPYEGYAAIFPSDVYVRGSLQVSEGEFCGEPIGRDICG